MQAQILFWKFLGADNAAYWLRRRRWDCTVWAKSDIYDCLVPQMSNTQYKAVYVLFTFLRLSVICQMNLGKPVLSHHFLCLFQMSIFGAKWHAFFMDWMIFLSSSQQSGKLPTGFILLFIHHQLLGEGSLFLLGRLSDASILSYTTHH